MTASEHLDRATPEQLAGWRRMTPAERLRLADRHRTMCLRLVEAGVRKREPGIDDATVRRRMAEILLRG